MKTFRVTTRDVELRFREFITYTDYVEADEYRVFDETYALPKMAQFYTNGYVSDTKFYVESVEEI